MPIKEMFQGFCMALADSVPGVSGGSIAFIMGFYEKFIGSLNGIFSRDRNERREGFKFLIKLFAGWIIGMGLAVVTLSNLFETHIYGISSLFLGFILVSIVVIWVLSSVRRSFQNGWRRRLKRSQFRRGMLSLVWWSVRSTRLLKDLILTVKGRGSNE